MRKVWWLSASGIVLAVILVLGLALLDGPHRDYAERQINAHLKGYAVAIGALHVHPIGLSIDFQNLTIRPSKLSNGGSCLAFKMNCLAL